MADLQQRFEAVFHERMEQFENKKPSERREEAARVINVFRALFASPLLSSFQPRTLYTDAMSKITETESLSWTELDSSSVPPEYSADVSQIQAMLFAAEQTSEFPKKISQFGRLSVEGLEKDY